MCAIIFPNKRGYFFIIDAFIALFVLTLGVVLTLSFFYSENSFNQTTLYSNSMLDFFSRTRIIDLNNEYAGAGGTLHRDGNITNLDNTLLSQIGELYYRNQTYDCNFCIDIIKKFVSNITDNYVASQYNVAVFIEDEPVFEDSWMNPNQSFSLIPAKRIIHGVYNKSEMWGPYEIEVRTWR